MKKRISIIVGGTGQFGITIAKILLQKDYFVIITTRNAKKAKKKINIKNKNLKIVKLNILKINQIDKILNKYDPNLIFYFAGLSSPGTSFKKPKETYLSNYKGCKNFLEAIKFNNKKCKFLNSSSCEIFSNTNKKLNINSKKKPISPYGKSKLLSFKLTRKFRKNYNLKSYNAVIFNTESVYREKHFLIPKICLAAIKAKKFNIKTSFGDLNVVREWNWCEEQCALMLKFLNKKPQDFILSNNKPFSATKMLNFAFKYFKLNYKDFIYFDKKNLRKKDFKSRLADNKKNFKINKISFKYKIYGKKIIEKLINYYLKKKFFK